MAAIRCAWAIALALALPLAASARETYRFNPELPDARGLDPKQLVDVVKQVRVGKGALGTITPKGGKVALAGLTLEFPKGAVAKTTKVVWQPLAHPQVLFGLLLEPRDTRIAKPLVLHGPKADLVLNVNRLGAYVLLADKQTQTFHFVNLVAMGPLARSRAPGPQGSAPPIRRQAPDRPASPKPTRH